MSGIIHRKRRLNEARQNRKVMAQTIYRHCAIFDTTVFWKKNEQQEETVEPTEQESR